MICAFAGFVLKLAVLVAIFWYAYTLGDRAVDRIKFIPEPVAGWDV